MESQLNGSEITPQGAEGQKKQQKEKFKMYDEKQ